MKRLILLSMAVLVALAAISCNKDQPAEDEGNKEPAVVELSGITLSEHTLSLKKGESTRLEVTFTPANATDKTVTWESSDPSVATVQNGEVKGLAAGTAEITAKGYAPAPRSSATISPGAEKHLTAKRNSRITTMRTMSPGTSSRAIGAYRQ